VSNRNSNSNKTHDCQGGSPYPTGYTRSDVIVELTYYVPIFPVNNAIMALVNRNGRTLAKMTGEVCWHPVMEAKKNQHGGFNPDSYPHYVYIRANG
jgi:hypothetical protein